MNNYSAKESAGLKLWIELIRCSNQLERTIDKKFRQHHGQNISRFDVLSQLARHQETGLTVTELGLQLIAVQGNITGLVNRMINDQLIIKTVKAEDKRSFVVTISSKGLALFKEMADNHAHWIAEVFDSMKTTRLQEITQMLGEARSSIAELSNGKK